MPHLVAICFNAVDVIPFNLMSTSAMIDLLVQ